MALHYATIVKAREIYQAKHGGDYVENGELFKRVVSALAEAAEQLRALDLPCAECGEVFEAHKYNNCGHEFVNANKPAAQQSFAADSNPAEPVVSAMDMDDIRNPRYKSGR